MKIKIHPMIRGFLIALSHGILLSAIFFLTIMWRHEDTLFDQILDKTITQEMNQEEKALALLNVTHSLMADRNEFFQYQPQKSLRDRFLRSADLQLLDSKGACGSHAHVLGRLLQRSEIPVRIAQMQCDGPEACHVVLEAKIDDKYVVLDPLYNLSFRNAENELMSIDEVGHSWKEVTPILPTDYNANYNYQKIRYTNWNKIPVIMPAMKFMVSLFTRDADHFSLRSHLLNQYRFLGITTIVIYLLLLAYTLFWIRKNASYLRRVLRSA